MQEINHLHSDVEDISFQNNQLLQKGNARYACMVLQNSVDFSYNNSRLSSNINSRKTSAQCIAKTVNCNLSSQSTMLTQLSTRRTSIQSSQIQKKQFTQPYSFNELDSTQSTEQTRSSKINTKLNDSKINSVLEISYLSSNNSQDDTFKKLIKDKLNSKSRFEDIYGVQSSAKRDRFALKSSNIKQTPTRSRILYDSNNNSCSGGSNSSTGYCNGNNIDDEQIVSLSEISPFQQIQQSPPFKQIQVKEKQARSKSVLTSAKLPSINKQNYLLPREQSIFNSQKTSSKVIQNNSSLIFSEQQLKDDYLQNQGETPLFNSPQKLRSRRQFMTPKRSPECRVKKNAIKFDENNAITKECFKLIANKEDSQHIQFIRIHRNQLKQYLSTLYDAHSAELLINYIDYPSALSYQNFLQKTEDFANGSSLELCLFAFLLYDINSDGYICNTDLFNRWKSSNNLMGQDDVNDMVRYAQNQLNKREQAVQTMRLLKESQKKHLIASPASQTPKFAQEEQLYELESSIISSNKLISMNRYRQLKSKNEIALPEIKSRQYTWYTRCFQVQEHYSNVRMMHDEIRQFEDSVKKHETKKVHFNKLTGDFILNFEHFCEIFKTSPPRIVYDMIASLTGYLYNHINYPYSENVILQNNMQLIASQQKSTRQQENQQLSFSAITPSNVFLQQQMEQKSSVECFKLQFSQMLTNQ